MRSGPGSFLWVKGGEQRNTCTKRGRKGKAARTTQRPRAGITNSNLKKTSRARRGARRRRRCPGAGPGRAGGSRLLPSPGEGTRAAAPSPAAPSPPGTRFARHSRTRGGAFVASWQPGGLRVCVRGEVNVDGVGEETKGFFRGRGVQGEGGRGSEFRQRLRKRGSSGSGEGLQRDAG